MASTSGRIDLASRFCRFSEGVLDSLEVHSESAAFFDWRIPGTVVRPLRTAKVWTGCYSNQRTLCGFTVRLGRLQFLKYGNRRGDRAADEGIDSADPFT
jgi:hypothetical protein